MPVGHLGVGLIAKGVEPRINLGTLFLASMLLDVVLLLLKFAGVEGGGVVPSDFGTQHVMEFDLPYSHSLVGALALSLIAGACGVVRDVANRERGAMRKLILYTVLSTLLATGAQAEQQRDGLLDHMTGHWVLTGTIAGQQTTHDIDAEWVLQNTYVRLREVSREKDAAGKPQYEAEVLVGYDAAKSRYTCFWFDITGVASPGSGGIALRQSDVLPFVFKSEQGDFHTTFVYQTKTDTWTWAMDAEQDGKLAPFARVALSRP